MRLEVNQIQVQRPGDTKGIVINKALRENAIVVARLDVVNQIQKGVKENEYDNNKFCLDF